MILPPIVERELRVASRRAGTYWIRLLAALLLLVVCFWSLLVLGRFQPISVAVRMTFNVVSWSLFGLALAAGVRGTADCLSEEKRAGTLGLLFLTDLAGGDIVMGKLVANSVRATQAVLAALPVLAVPVIVGGVGFGEFFRVALAQLNALFFALSAGMVASAFGGDDRRAAAGASLLLLVFLGYYHLLPGLLNLLGSGWRPPEALACACPWYPIAHAGSTTRQAAAETFWYPLLLGHFLAWGGLALSARVLPGQWQDHPEAGRAGQWREGWRRWLEGAAEKRSAWRAHLLSRNPFLWLACRDRFQRLAVWSMLAAAVLVWLAAVLHARNIWLTRIFLVLTAIGLHSILTLWVAAQAGYRFAHDRQSGAMEILLSTPFRVSQIIRGQRLALLRQFLGPVMMVLIWDAVLHAVGQLRIRSDSSEGVMLWTATFVAGMAVFVANLLSMQWVGMWLGLGARRIYTITGTAMLRILVIPWVVLFGFITLQLLAGQAPQPWHWLFIWVMASMVNNALWASWSKRRLYGEFRSRATERYQPSQPPAWQYFLEWLLAPARRRRRRSNRSVAAGVSPR